MGESLTRTQRSRALTEASQVPTTAKDTVPEEFLKIYIKPLQSKVDLPALVIHRQKKYGQIRKHRLKRLDEVRRNIMANPLEEPVTVTA